MHYLGDAMMYVAGFIALGMVWEGARCLIKRL